MISIKKQMLNLKKYIFEDSLSIFDWVSIFLVMSLSQYGWGWLFSILPLLAISIYMRRTIKSDD